MSALSGSLIYKHSQIEVQLKTSAVIFQQQVILRAMETIKKWKTFSTSDNRILSHHAEFSSGNVKQQRHLSQSNVFPVSYEYDREGRWRTRMKLLFQTHPLNAVTGIIWSVSCHVISFIEESFWKSSVLNILLLGRSFSNLRADTFFNCFFRIQIFKREGNEEKSFSLSLLFHSL